MILNLELTDESLDEAIRKVEQYSKDFKDKTARFTDEVASRVKTSAVDKLAGHIETAETIQSVKVQHRFGSYTARVLAGGAAIWLEFGTGVVANSVGVGAFPHPKAAELGMMGIGTYGEGHGADPDGWWYYDETGRRRHTYGIPATMFMYHSAMEVRDMIPGIARRIYGT